MFGKGTISYTNYDLYDFYTTGACVGWKVEYNSTTTGITTQWVNGALGGPRIEDVKVVVGTTPVCVGNNCNRTGLCKNSINIEFKGSYITATPCVNPEPLPPTTDQYRQVFNSPETSFGQPFLGDILKVESVIFGKGEAHFVQVKDNAKYRLISKEAQEEALNSAAKLGGITDPFGTEAMFAAYQAYLEIYLSI